MRKTIKKKKSKISSGGGGPQQFLILHCEKFVVVVIAVVALWFALQGLGFMGPQISWQPNVLIDDATAARTTIEGNMLLAADVMETEPVDHAANAGQMRSPVDATPYRFETPWPFAPSSSQRSSQGM